MVCGPLSSNDYRTWHLSPGSSTKHVHPWFYNSLFTPAGPQPTWRPELEDESYEVEAILKIDKCETHAKVK